MIPMFFAYSTKNHFILCPLHQYRLLAFVNTCVLWK